MKKPSKLNVNISFTDTDVYHRLFSEVVKMTTDERIDESVREEYVARFQEALNTERE